MTPQIQNWIKKIKKKYIATPGNVLEIGSLNINGGVRDFFPDAKKYIGIDMEKGKGVDKVLQAHNILKVWKPKTFDTVVCLEMLEHDNAPWITIDIVHQVLKPGGYLIVSTPTFGFPIHRYPKDYFRYGEDAYREIIFKGFKILNLVHVKDYLDQPGICCVGQKPGGTKPTPVSLGIGKMLQKLKLH